MKLPLSEKQIQFLDSKLKLRFSAADDISIAQFDELYSGVVDYLQKHGINKAGNGPNTEGKMCVDVLNAVAEIE